MYNFNIGKSHVYIRKYEVIYAIIHNVFMITLCQVISMKLDVQYNPMYSSIDPY